MHHVDRTGVAAQELLSQLVYELLDAHADTQQLAADLAPAPGWSQHLDYLRGLQRVGRETLAGLGARGA
jgi:hypothetical protein